MKETTTLNKKEEINTPTPTPTPSDTLYIRKYLSRKGKLYYGTFLNGTFYFVHIKDGTELERHETKKDKKEFFIWEGAYNTISLEDKHDVFIGW